MCNFCTWTIVIPSFPSMALLPSSLLQRVYIHTTLLMRKVLPYQSSIPCPVINRRDKKIKVSQKYDMKKLHYDMLHMQSRLYITLCSMKCPNIKNNNNALLSFALNRSSLKKKILLTREKTCREAKGEYCIEKRTVTKRRKKNSN